MEYMSHLLKKEKIPLINWPKLRGKEIAIVEGKVVAQGDSSKEVFDKAKKLFPKKSSRDITLLSVPKERVSVYTVL